jgi:asparagine synthase (glutamine-hydrolysing)
MCGICGIFNFDPQQRVQPETLRAMNRQIVHRGPDDEGSYCDANVGIAMRRLSIVDLKSGHQPLSNEDGTIWIVFNGEIYNHGELRPVLEKQGHHFRTSSDTETIVHLYEQHGENCVRHLRGMFAFAVWDGRRRRLFCARDRLGIKPFYYSLQGRRLIFGSEIKTLLEFPAMRAELNKTALPEYLAFGYSTGSGTLFAGVKRLEPGHWLTVDERGTFKVERYWDLLDSYSHKEPRPFEQDVRNYRELLEQAVQSHLMSDVPLGMLLSGGLDSSVVAALLRRQRKDPIQTFSVGYPEAESSELPMAHRVAQHLGTEHHEVKINAESFFGALPHLIWHEDEPLVWPSSVSLYFVCRLARENVKVVLTGEGSDETLAGYDRYAWTLWNSRLDSAYRSVVPEASRRWIAKQISHAGWIGARTRRRLGHTFFGRDGRSIESFYFDNFYSAFSGGEQAGLLCEDIAADAYEGSTTCWKESKGEFLDRLLQVDLKTYLVELLMKQDNMSMAASIESRVPYLDHVLVEYALGIPPGHKVRGLSGKHVLKSAASDLLPKQVIDQRKRGFPTPWRTWLSSGWVEKAEQLIFAPRAQERGLFRPETLQRLLAEHRAQAVDNSDRIWRLVNLELWHRIFIDADPAFRQDSDQEPQPTVAHFESWSHAGALRT